jgi:hypothetical protein
MIDLSLVNEASGEMIPFENNLPANLGQMHK